MKKTDKNKSNSAYGRFCEKAAAMYGSHRRLSDMLLVGLLFLVLLGVRIHDINIKNQLHSDEVFSLMLSTCNEYYHNPIPDGEYTGEELKTLITADDTGGVGGALSDIAKLWHNNGDAPHASLYYMVLRLALIGFDSLDVHELSWRGGALNLVFFALSFFFMYKLLRRIYGNRILLVAAGLAMAFGNWMSIHNTLLIREYQMAETGIIVFSLIGISLLQAIRGGGAVDKRKYLAGFSLSIAAVVSLGYFNAVYVVLFGAVVLASCFRYKRRDLVPWLLASAAVAIVVALLLYPGFFNFLLHDSVHKERAFGSVRNILRYVFVRDFTFMFFTVYGLMIMALLLAVVLLSKNRGKLFQLQNFAWIPVVVLVCMLFIQYASVLKMPRYYFALMPMMALIVPHAISCVPKSWTGYFELLILLYFPILTIIYPVRANYRWSKLRNSLDRSTIVFKLNPNEVVQLIPCMNDTVEYSMCNTDYLDIKRDRETYVATKLQIAVENDSVKTSRALLWGRQIYMYKFEVVKNGGE